MKKFLVVLIALFTVTLAACGNDNASENGTSENKILRIGASNVPHAEILEQAKPILEEKGITLEITTFQDFVLPNRALADGEIDANYFQHIPFFEKQIAENGYEFENAGGIHIEPIGIYSQRHDSLEDLPDGATVMMSNSVADHGRMLSLLEQHGLITLQDGVEKTEAQLSDIAENPRNLQFVTDIDASMLVQAYENDEADVILINSNFAIGAGLDPMTDAIALEDSNSPFVNIIAVRQGDADNEEIQTLVEVLRSEEIQNFILETYNGAVVPVSE